jgi:general secretion pathway protein D
MLCALLGCAALDATKSDLRMSAAGPGVGEQVRDLDLTPRFPTSVDESSNQREPSQPLIFPGAENDPEPQREQNEYTRVASAQPGAVLVGQGVEMNFDGADIRTVAKTLLGDVLKLNVLVDPRVQGNVTLASVGAIPRKDLLPAFESALRLSNAAVVREGSLVKIVPLSEAGGSAASMGAGQPGYGVSIVPLRYVSAATVAKTAEGFLSRAGALRVIPSRNIVLIQGTTSERQSALDLISTFDVEWLRNQSVAVYPLKSTSPETMIAELERIFESSDGGMGQGVVRFQPISRMNAVMVVARSPKLLTETTQWVQRLDRSDTTGTTLRTYRLKHGNATKVAKILNDIFVGSRSGTTSDAQASPLAPGSEGAKSKLDSLDRGTNANNRSSSSSTQTASSNSSNQQFAAAFDAFADRKGNGDETANATPASLGAPGRGPFQNIRITADTSNNAVVVYSTQEDYRVVERALRDIDRPRLQVAIDATVAEITLTDDLKFGVQYFLTSKDVGAGNNKGSIGLLNAAQSTAQSALLQRVTPGLNFLIGSEALPRVILNALSTLTDVKVLSSPSIVAMDNQPALLQVGDEVPITTSTATLLTAGTTPTVNTIEMRNTGVILKVLPQVNANGAIQLEIDQEISNVVNPDQQTLTPTISQRRVHSSVAVTSGQTVLLAGLISEREQQTKAGIPGLQNIKFLGDLLGNTSATKQRSEIIIFIRTRLMRNSIDASAVTEEFRERLQAMRSSRTVVDGAAASDPAPLRRK